MKPIRSIGIIMDGNRRWAKARGLPAWEGHRAALEPLRALAKAFPTLKEKYGLEYATFYTFSTENWNRAPDEVQHLMDLFEVGFQEIVKAVAENSDPRKGLRVRMVGQRERFSPKIQKIMADTEEKTAQYTGGTAIFALSYGGRAEILTALGKLAAKGIANPTEEEFSSELWTAGIPDPDIIVRTGGEKRLSGFLTWQSVYSELFFTDTQWPDFSVAELEGIFEEFQNRERRHGQ